MPTSQHALARDVVSAPSTKVVWNAR